MSKITLLDGASGTQLWEKAEKNGLDKVSVWKYNIVFPEIVGELALDYAKAGSEIIFSNTFGANRRSVQQDSEYDSAQVVFDGVKIAKEALKGTGVKVALDCGPLTTLLKPYGPTTPEECENIYDEMFYNGMKAGADLIVIETFMDLEMARIATATAKQYGVPVLSSMTFEKNGRTLMGNKVKNVCNVLENAGADAVGINCSLGPDMAVPIIREFAENTRLPLILKPNAGIPIPQLDGSTKTVFNPVLFASDVSEAFPYVSYIGGCCGSDPSYIAAIKKKALEMGY